MAVPFIMPADAVREVIYPQTRKINVAKQTIKANKTEKLKKMQKETHIDFKMVGQMLVE